MLWHAGTVPGYSAFLAVLPESDEVVVVLQDASGPLQDDRLVAPGLAAVDALVGRAPAAPAASWPYPTLLAALGLAIVGLVVLRLRARGRWVVTVGAVTAVVALSAPYFAGLDPRTAWLWFPDVTVLLGLLAATGVLLCIPRSRDR